MSTPQHRRCESEAAARLEENTRSAAIRLHLPCASALSATCLPQDRNYSSQLSIAHAASHGARVTAPNSTPPPAIPSTTLYGLGGTLSRSLGSNGTFANPQTDEASPTTDTERAPTKLRRHRRQTDPTSRPLRYQSQCSGVGAVFTRGITAKLARWQEV